jgi:hypothetical protein
MGLFRFTLFPLTAFALYMLPTIIAVARHKQNALTIGLINFFLGWSIIGWVLMLVWALSADAPAVVYAAPYMSAAGYCPHCGKLNPTSGQFCSNCGQAMSRPATIAGT